MHSKRDSRPPHCDNKGNPRPPRVGAVHCSSCACAWSNTYNMCNFLYIKNLSYGLCLLLVCGSRSARRP